MKESHICGARNRQGGRCKRAPMPNGRCPNHGGKSLKGFAHPNFKHGGYSKYDVMGIWISYELQIRALKRRLSRYEPKYKLAPLAEIKDLKREIATENTTRRKQISFR